MKNKIIYLPALSLTLVTALSGVMLAASRVSAESADATVSVVDSCAFGSSGYSWTFSAVAGGTYDTTSVADSAKEVSVSCNDPDGFYVKAAGNPSTVLAGTTAGHDIATNTTGSSSYWAFKVSSASNDISGGTASIASGYGSYHTVPASATPIITYSGSASSIVTGKFRTDYEVSISSTQVSDTYSGGVEYTIVAI